ncbi:MAG: hypothetical protein QW304_03375 [Thermoproteota archaeon]
MGNCPVGAVKIVSGMSIVNGQLYSRCGYGGCLAKCPAVSLFLKDGILKTACNAQLTK